MRTTFPYTLVVGILSIVFGSVPVGMGLYGPWVALLVGAAVIVALVYGVGKTPPNVSVKDAKVE